MSTNADRLLDVDTPIDAMRPQALHYSTIAATARAGNLPAASLAHERMARSFDLADDILSKKLGNGTPTP